MLNNFTNSENKQQTLEFINIYSKIITKILLRRNTKQNKQTEEIDTRNTQLSKAYQKTNKSDQYNEMSNCVTYGNVNYCLVKDTFIVGDNVSCALVSDPTDGILFIPFKVNSSEVKEIGANAFTGCSSIERVTIEARITQINNDAFRECLKLVSINIPNTCRLIKEWGIQTYNSTLGNSLPNQYKSLTIFFEPNSKIKYIDTHGISYRENVNIYTCERINPILQKNSFIKVSNLRIYSPSSFVMNNTRSTTSKISSQCKRSITYQHKHSCGKSIIPIMCFIQLLSQHQTL